MSAYQEWIVGKRKGRGLNQPRARDEPAEHGEAPPFDRRRIIANELRKAEQDLAFTTRWLADPLAAHNREDFLDLAWDANDRYSRALRLVHQLSL